MPEEDSIATRASLLERLKNCEDQASWQEFFGCYWQLIYRVAKKGGLTDAEAEDVVQETVISVSKKLPGFVWDPKICSFKTWMLRMTRWRVIDTLRKRMPLVEPHEDQTGTPSLEKFADLSPPELEAVWDAEWEKSLLSAALERIKPQIKPDHYQIFDLSVLRELPISDVAEIMGVTAARIYLVKHRITRLIQKAIREIQISSQ
jgi:RNA polymerase sigma factor (sigma-70 family)